jgi:ADP-ribosyl-[dinitrogen reductase] hydrolase
MPNPLIIAAVDTKPGWGRVMISCCPGRTDMDHVLPLDIAALKRAGAAAVITLTEFEELEELEVPGLGQAVREAGMEWFNLPIVDYGAPNLEWEKTWAHKGKAVRAMIRDGRTVHMHCRGGCGRSGMLAAALLVELGVCEPEEAIRRMRFARPCAIETDDQEDYVRHSRPLAE